MQSFALIILSVGCLFVGIQAAAVENKVTELQKDFMENATTERQLSSNEDCIQPKETGRCFALFYRFAYDVETRECVEFIYGGCAGNSNNFETKEDCEAKCLFSKQNSSEDQAETTIATITEAEITSTTEAAKSSS